MHNVLSHSTSRNDDRLAVSAPSYISHCNTDIVDGTTLQLIYSVVGGYYTATSLFTLSPGIEATIAGCSPHHL